MYERRASVSQVRSVAPSTYSMARYSRPSWAPTPKTATTFGWLSFAIALASRSRSEVVDWLGARSSSLSATLRPSRWS
ncbi:MAG: hypothetical protein QM765_33840 [Myxococcales bacterium]